MSRLVDPRELIRENHDLVQENKELTTVNEQLVVYNQRLCQSYVQGRHRIDNLNEQRSQDEEDLKKLREQCAKLESQNSGLRQDLQKCKDDLFRLQPASQVPDSEISDQYEALSNAISDWVDSEVARSADAWQKDYDNEPPQIFLHSKISHLEEILALYPESGGEYVLRFAIFNFLHRELFDQNIFLFGLQHSAFQSWKADTLTAIAASAECKQHRTKATNGLWVSLITELAELFPFIGDSMIGQESLYDKIVKPAVDLAVKVQTSTSIYVFKPRMLAITRLGRTPVTLHQMAFLKMIDVRSGKHLRAESRIVANERGEVGDEILILAPALFRRQSPSQWVRLTQKVILVELYQPLGRRCGNTAQPAQHQASGR